MPYKIILVKSAAKELGNLTAKTHDKIILRLRQIEENPRPFGAEKLTGYDAYKLRTGNYRIIYEIDDSRQEVKILMIEDRKQVYKRLRRKK